MVFEPAAGLVVAPEAAESLLLRPLPETLRALDRVVHRLDPKLPRLTLSLLDETLGDTIAVAPSTPAPSPPSAEELAEHGAVHALARFYDRDRRQIYRCIEQPGLKTKR